MADTKRLAVTARPMTSIRPFLLLLYLTLKYSYKFVIGFWLDPLLDARARKEFWMEIVDGMPFLLESADLLEKNDVQDDGGWPSVCIYKDSLRVRIIRYQAEFITSLAPRSRPQDAYDLSVVLNKLGKSYLQSFEEPTLGKIDDALRANWKQINEVFGEDRSFPEFTREPLRDFIMKQPVPRL